MRALLSPEFIHSECSDYGAYQPPLSRLIAWLREVLS